MNVPENHAFVIERLGRYHRTLLAGRHMLAPLIDRVAFRFSLAPQETQFTSTAITRDNVPMRMTTTVRWQIADAQRAAYASASVNDYVTGIVQSRQRDHAMQHDFDDVRETTRELRAAVVRACADAAAQAGVQILDVDVRDLARA
jgi:regulator of protease activity HflC (stomatin/prohibitin superfamily)